MNWPTGVNPRVEMRSSRAPIASSRVGGGSVLRLLIDRVERHGRPYRAVRPRRLRANLYPHEAKPNVRSVSRSSRAASMQRFWSSARFRKENLLSAAVFSKVGLDAMLTPDNCVLVLIDHQPFQVAGVRNIDPQTMINNTVGLAKTAKVFKVPTLLTTIIRDRGG